MLMVIRREIIFKLSNVKLFKTFNCEGEIHMFKSKKYEVGSTEGLLMYVHTYIYTLRMKCVCTYIHDGHFAPNH